MVLQPQGTRTSTTCGEWNVAHLMRRRAQIEHARARDERERGQPAARDREVERRGHPYVRVVEMRGAHVARAPPLSRLLC
jgi:hypothetical protein